MKAKTITVNSINITADLSDFPLRVVIANDSDIGSHCHANGYDIAFYDSLGNVLPHERREWSITNSAVTAEFFVRCNLSSSGTTITIKYGNPSASVDPSSPTTVWQDYDIVCPMTPNYTTMNGASCTVVDVSGNGNHSNANYSNSVNYSWITLPDGRKSIGIASAYNPIHWLNFDVQDSRTYSLTRYFSAAITENIQEPLVVNKFLNSSFDIYYGSAYTTNNLYRIQLKNSGSSSYYTESISHSLGSGSMANSSLFLSGTTAKAYYNGQAITATGSVSTADFTILSLRPYTTSGILEFRVKKSDISTAWNTFESANMSQSDGGVTFGSETNSFCLRLLRFQRFNSCV